MIEILTALVIATTQAAPPSPKKSDDGLIVLLALGVSAAVAASQKKTDDIAPKDLPPNDTIVGKEPAITKNETANLPQIQNNPLAWLDHAVEYGCVLVWGAQDGGKTTAASHLIKCRKDRGDRVIVLDPHAERGQWNGLEVVGAGMNYEEIDEFMEWYFTECRQRYQILRERGREAVKQLGTICLVAEEMTNYTERCKNSGKFIKACLSDNRKIFFNAVLISHNRTLSTLGNAKGMAQTRDDTFLELHCIPPSGGSPRRWTIKYPGGDFQSVDVPNWETIHNFGVQQTENDRERLERLFQMDTKSLTSTSQLSTTAFTILDIIKTSVKHPTTFEAIRKSRKWEKQPDKQALLSAIGELVSTKKIKGDENTGYTLNI